MKHLRFRVQTYGLGGTIRAGAIADRVPHEGVGLTSRPGCKTAEVTSGIVSLAQLGSGHAVLLGSPLRFPFRSSLACKRPRCPCLDAP